MSMPQLLASVFPSEKEASKRSNRALCRVPAQTWQCMSWALVMHCHSSSCSEGPLASQRLGWQRVPFRWMSSTCRDAESRSTRMGFQDSGSPARGGPGGTLADLHLALHGVHIADMLVLRVPVLPARILLLVLFLVVGAGAGAGAEKKL